MQDRNYLKKVIEDQRKELDSEDIGLPRDKLLNLGNMLEHKTNIVVTGHRRAGKSTFLLQWMKQQYNDDFYYFDFSDDRIAGLETKDLQLMYEIFLETYGERKVFLFDEIQGQGAEWNKFVNRLYKSGYRFFLSGSNAELLSKEISTYLTGRHYDIVMFPFSFREYLRYNNVSFDIKSTKEIANVQRLLNNYLRDGGFPEVLNEGSRNILNNIYNDVLTKDIIIRHNIRDKATFKKIAIHLISNFAREFSYTSLKNTYQLGSVHTASNYVSYLNDAYVLFELQRYAFSVKKQENNPKKIYCIDTGMINELAFAFSENIGRLYENLVFIELLRRGYKNNENLFYYKTKKDRETDFVLLKGIKIGQLIQVSYDVQDIKSSDREFEGIIEASNELKCNNLLLLTRDKEETIKKDGKKIKVMPIWKWLLE